MAHITVDEFASKYFPTAKNPKQKVYDLLRHQKQLKKPIKGLGLMIDENKYQKLIA